jgi:hypothetical protein
MSLNVMQVREVLHSGQGPLAERVDEVLAGPGDAYMREAAERVACEIFEREWRGTPPLRGGWGIDLAVRDTSSGRVAYFHVRVSMMIDADAKPTEASAGSSW